MRNSFLREPSVERSYQEIRLHKVVRFYFITCKILYRAIRSVNQPAVHCTIDNIAPSNRFRFGKVSIYPIHFILLCHDIRDVTKRCKRALHIGRYCTTK